MTEDELKKLRGHYYSLLGVQTVFDDQAGRGLGNIEDSPVRVLASELDLLEAEFPGLVPPFKSENFFDHRGTYSSFYKVSGIRSHIGMVIGKLKVAIDTSERTPVTQTRDFTFVKDADLRKVLERDYSEIQRSFIGKCWKSVIILSGGAIEAILTDLLLQNESAAKAAAKAPKKPDISKWDFADLINVAVELKLVSSGIEKLSHPIRKYRNLVHPGNEIRTKLKCGEEEARIALEILHIVDRDLST